jgi:hypothetical protein
MSNNKGKWWLAIVVMCCLAPATFAEREGERDRDRHRNEACGPHEKKCQQVPEGGSTAIYLLGAGLACFGAMFLRSRIAKPAQS